MTLKYYDVVQLVRHKSLNLLDGIIVIMYGTN